MRELYLPPFWLSASQTYHMNLEKRLTIERNLMEKIKCESNLPLSASYTYHMRELYLPLSASYTYHYGRLYPQVLTYIRKYVIAYLRSYFKNDLRISSPELKI